jgi:hypothetical protein
LGSPGSAVSFVKETSVLTGHFAIAFIGKRVERKLSLGTLVFACLLSDFLWCVFMIAGIEHVRVKQGITILPGMRGIDVLEASEISYSHSLLMTGIWGALLALLYFSRRRNSRAALTLFAVVVSHWILDFISHPPDMQLIPGEGKQHFGLALWNSIPATLVIEGAFWVAAILLYIRGTRRPRSRIGSLAFWIGCAIVTAAWIGNITGPPPADLSTIGFTSLSFFSLTVAWTFWMNRIRPNQ